MTTETKAPKNRPGMKGMTVVMPESDYQRISKISKTTGRYVAELIRTWVKDGVEFFEAIERKEQERHEKYD